MNIIRKVTDAQRVALTLLAESGIPQKEMQAFGILQRLEDNRDSEFHPDYIVVATKRYFILDRLKDWSTNITPFSPLKETYELDSMRLIECKKGFLNYILTLEVNGQIMHLAIAWRFSWHNYEPLALYLSKRLTSSTRGPAKQR